MKKTNLLCCFTLLMLSLFSNAQDSGIINIQGIIKGVEIKKGTASIIPISIGLDCMAYKFDSMTVAVVNNHFHFAGTIPYPHAFEEIIFRSTTASFGTSSFFLDSGNIDMACFYDSEKHVNPNIQFSKTNYEYQNKFLPKYSSIQNILDSFFYKRADDYEKYNKAIPDSVYKEDLKIRTEYTIKKNAFLKLYIKQNPDSYIPLAILGQSVGRYDYDMPEIKKTFSLLSPKMRNTVSGLKLKKAIEIKNLTSLSDSLKKLAFINEKNIQKTIDVHNNKYTLVDFWFSNCGPCIKQFPRLLSIYQTYKNKGFEIIGISTDENADEWKNAVIKYNLKWQQLWDEKNFTLSRLLISSFPTNFLLDSSGKIVEENIEPSRLEEFLKINISKK